MNPYQIVISIVATILISSCNDGTFTGHHEHDEPAPFYSDSGYDPYYDENLYSEGADDCDENCEKIEELEKRVDELEADKKKDKTREPDPEEFEVTAYPKRPLSTGPLEIVVTFWIPGNESDFDPADITGEIIGGDDEFEILLGSDEIEDSEFEIQDGFVTITTWVPFTDDLSSIVVNVFLATHEESASSNLESVELED